MIFDRMAELATCLCSQIREDGSPETCFCGIIPGAAVISDYAGSCGEDGPNGMAWVRLASMNMMTGVGILNENPGNCGAELGSVLEVGILRFIGVGDDWGNPPEPGDLLGHTEQQVKDAVTMLRAIVCCPSLPNKDYILGPYEPFPVLGSLVGGTWTLTVL